MKRFYPFIFLILLSGTVLNAQVSAAEQTTVQQSSTPVQETEKIPIFENKDLQNFAREYLDFYNKVKKAIAEADNEKLANLQSQTLAIQEKLGTIAPYLSSEDRDLFVDWSNKLNQSLNN